MKNKKRHINGKRTSPRTYAFIDSQNVHRGIRALGWEMDWKRFREMLRDKLGVERALLFIGHVEGNESLYEELKQAGFELVFKETVVVRKDGVETVKGNVDADLVLHAMIEHPHYDKAVIATGDGDFRSLAKHLKSEGKLGTLIVPQGKRASKLLKEFDRQIVPLDGMRGALERKDEPETIAPKPVAKKTGAAPGKQALHPVWW